MSPIERPYGAWTSPWSADHISSAVVRLSHCTLDSGNLYWLELRPAENGRAVIVCRKADGTIYDITPPEYNVRTKVHEYGGGAFLINNGTVYFSNFADGGVYRQEEGKSPEKLVAEPDCRFADFVLDKRHDRLLAVKEQHFKGGEPINSLDYIMLDGSGRTESLLMGSDFFSSPRINAEGKLLTWMSWNHPNMPWDESALWTANIGSDGFPSNVQKVAGGREESVYQPEWADDGTLFFVSDQNGWWNLHASYSGLVEPVVETESEFGYPHWVFGWTTYSVKSPAEIYCAVNRKGLWTLAVVNAETRDLQWIDCPFTDLSFLKCDERQLAFIGGSPYESSSVWLMDLKTREFTRVRRSVELTIDPGYISKPEVIEYDTTGGERAYAIYYPPVNKDFTAPAADKPPLIVKSHGGPTAACTATLNPSIQYWTSRGFAIVDVNYRGSTGFGRKYREKLNGQWGIVDVDDCEFAARHLAGTNRSDGSRMSISGGSAGGYTTLCALTFRKTFAAGASYYGISDLVALAQDTHKFESRYEDRLVGNYPAEKDIYHARSPINFASSIKCPVIFFQGLEDKVVPPSQSELMVNALRKNKVPVVYMSFEGEQHGFRKSGTIKRCLEAELQFYCTVFSVTRDDFTERLQIENFEAEEVG